MRAFSVSGDIGADLCWTTEVTWAAWSPVRSHASPAMMAGIYARIPIQSRSVKRWGGGGLGRRFGFKSLRLMGWVYQKGLRESIL